MLQNEILALRNPVSAQMAPKITEVAPKNDPFWFPFRNLVRRSSFGCILAVLWFTCGSLLLAFGTGSEQFWERFGIKKTIETSPKHNQKIIQISLQYPQDTTTISLTHHRYFTKTSPQHNQNIIRTLPDHQQKQLKHHQNITNKSAGDHKNNLRTPPIYH